MTVSFNACRRDQEEGVELGFQRSPGEDKSRDVELGSEGMSHGLLLRAVPQQRCNGYCLCDSEVETASVWYTSATQWRGPHCINIAVGLAVVHSLLGLSGSKRAKKEKRKKKKRKKTFQTPQSDAVLPVAVLPEGNHLATF